MALPDGLKWFVIHCNYTDVSGERMVGRVNFEVAADADEALEKARNYFRVLKARDVEFVDVAEDKPTPRQAQRNKLF